MFTNGKVSIKPGELKMKAWLITWEWLGDHAKVKEPIINIVSARRSPEYIKSLVDFYFSCGHYSLREKCNYARYNKPDKPPYTAQYVNENGRCNRNKITCGDNLLITATKVINLKFVSKEDGSCELTWDKRPAS